MQVIRNKCLLSGKKLSLEDNKNYNRRRRLEPNEKYFFLSGSLTGSWGYLTGSDDGLSKNAPRSAPRVHQQTFNMEKG